MSFIVTSFLSTRAPLLPWHNFDPGTYKFTITWLLKFSEITSRTSTTVPLKFGKRWYFRLTYNGRITYQCWDFSYTVMVKGPHFLTYRSIAMMSRYGNNY